MRTRIACGFALLCACACSGSKDRTTADAAPPDGGRADGDGAPDAGGEDVDLGPRPVAPEREAEPANVSEWMVGRVWLDGVDPVEEAIEAGTFGYPDEGEDENGVAWRVVEPGEFGSLGEHPPTLVYAVARVDLDEGTRLFARTDRTFGIFGNGALQPGDIYGSRRMRVPLQSHAGENLAVVQAAGGRGALEAELFTTPDEIYFNREDLTFPDLVVGDEGDLYLGVAVLNLTSAPCPHAVAQVVENDTFEATSIEYPSIPGAAVTQVAFLLRRKGPVREAGQMLPVRIHFESRSLDFAYEREIQLATVARDATHRRTFRSPDDGSVQYYGVVPPSGFDAMRSYGLALTVHGAGVDAIGQAQAYSAKDWTYVVAPTNRRGFGFDWEEWGHFNALYSLDDAMAHYGIDPTRVYLTGHSMGGHGTWHNGVINPGRFATLGPSAGWLSFYSYVDAPRPTGPFGRARAHSDTGNYVTNLARRGVYVIHGEADDNVPVREGRDNAALARTVTDDVVYHEEPGAGHWWDGDASPGADCVDWPPLFEFMQAHTLDPFELEFDFTSPSPSYSPRHSFVTIESAQTPEEDCRVTSGRMESTVVIETENVRSLRIDGAALRERGITDVEVDGDAHDVPDGDLWIGPEDGKRSDRYGPYNQVYRRPFCFVYPDDGTALANYASYMTSTWAIIGNGLACALPISRLSRAIRDSYNLVYLGLPASALGDPDVPFEWDAEGVRFDGRNYFESSLLFVFPERGHLSAALVPPPGFERDLYGVVPFSSRAGMPDYLIWRANRANAAGFFDADWRYDPDLGVR